MNGERAINPCPTCNGSALVALCGRTNKTGIGGGPCVMRSGHVGPCWGENDVASDWSPAAACATCCVCPCGSTNDGTLCRFCGVTTTPGSAPACVGDLVGNGLCKANSHTPTCVPRGTRR